MACPSSSLADLSPGALAQVASWAGRDVESLFRASKAIREQLVQSPYAFGLWCLHSHGPVLGILALPRSPFTHRLPTPALIAVLRQLLWQGAEQQPSATISNHHLHQPDSPVRQWQHDAQLDEAQQHHTQRWAALAPLVAWCLSSRGQDLLLAQWLAAQVPPSELPRLCTSSALCQAARMGSLPALEALSEASPGVRREVLQSSMVLWSAAVEGHADVVAWWLRLEQQEASGAQLPTAGNPGSQGYRVDLGLKRQALSAAITSAQGEDQKAAVVAALLPACDPASWHDDHGFERGSHPVTAAITYGAGRSVLLALLNGGVRPPPAALRAAVCAAGRGSPHEDPGEAAWLVEQLVVAGAEVDAMSGAALREAAAQGDEALVAKLLGLGAAVHHLQEDALRSAAARGHTPVVEALCRAGADVWVFGGAPLRVARQGGHEGVAQVLHRYMYPEGPAEGSSAGQQDSLPPTRAFMPDAVCHFRSLHERMVVEGFVHHGAGMGRAPW